MDHIQGLGFFRPLFDPRREIHVWGPPSTTQDLRARLTRYLSPPLFPVRIRDLGAHVQLRDAPLASWQVGGLSILAATVIHPGPTLGYRVASDGRSMAYLSDHEPALGGSDGGPDWTSGHDPRGRRRRPDPRRAVHGRGVSRSGSAGATAASSRQRRSRISPGLSGSSSSTTTLITAMRSSTRCSSGPAPNAVMGLLMRHARA